MSDVITRLKVQSNEYESKLQRASQQLKSMAENAKRTGADIALADEAEIKFAQSLGEMATRAQSTKGQLKEIDNAITDMTIAYRGMTDEEKNSPFGRSLARSIDQLTERAGQARDAIDDVRAAVRAAASDTRGFDQMAGAMTTMTSTFQVGQGAAELFGIELGDNVEVLAKLQAAMAVTNGLQVIQNNLQKQSALMQGVANVQRAAATAAENLNTAAKSKNIVVTNAAKAAQAAFNLVANANPYVLLATAIAGATAALVAFSGESESAAEKEEKLQKASEEAAQKIKETQSMMANAAMSYTVAANKISDLATRYHTANDEISKTGVLKEAQAEFRKLGISCDGVTDAQRILVQNGPKIIEALDYQAQAAALAAVAMEKYKESFSILLSNGYDISGARILASAGDYRKIMEEVNSLNSKASAIFGTMQRPSGGSYSTHSSGNNNNSVQEKTEEQKIQEQINKLIKDYGVASKANNESQKTAIRTQIAGLNEQLDAIKRIKDEALGMLPVEGSADWYTNKIQDLQKKWNAAATDMEREGIKKQIDETQAILDKINGKEVKVKINMTASSGAIERLNDELELVKKSQSQAANADDWVTMQRHVEEVEARIVDLTTAQNLLNEVMSKSSMSEDFKTFAESLGLAETLGQEWEKALNGDNIPDETWTKLAAKINEKLKELGIDTINLDVKTGATGNSNETQKTKNVNGLQETQKIWNGFTQVTDGLEALGVEFGDGFKKVVTGINAVFGVITGISSIVSSILLLKSLESWKSFLPWSNGGFLHAANGVITGSHFSGDVQPLMVNAGEGVINQADQANLWRAIKEGNFGGGGSSVTVRGDELFITLNNYMRSSGMRFIS